jgi:ATP-dependent Lon protease
VLIPKDNEKDLAEIPDNVKSGLKIIPVKTADEVLALALTEPVKPVEWTESDAAALAALGNPPPDSSEPQVAH